MRGNLRSNTRPVLPYEVLEVLRQSLPIDIGSGLDFAGNFRGNVPGPMFECVEGNDTDRIAEPPRQQV